jgi:hypothetical protein
MTTEGNVISVTAGTFEGFRTPLLFAAPFAGAVYGFVADDTAFHGVSWFSPGSGAAIRSIDGERDGQDQLLLAESAPADYLSVWRREPAPGIDGRLRSSPRCALVAWPSPFRDAVQVLTDPPGTAVAVYDATGRLVTRVEAGPHRAWRAGNAAPGVYLLRAGTARTGVVLAR